MAERPSAIEQFGKLKASHKFAMWALLSAFIAVAFYIFFYQDLQDEIENENKRKIKLTKDLSEYTTQLNTKHQYQEQIQALYRKRQIALEKLPEAEEIPSLLQKIDGLGKIVGLQMTSFVRLEPIDMQFYSIIPVKMEMVGTYHQIATFFHYIGKLTRIVNISEVNLLDPEQQPDGRVLLQAKFLATTYRYRKPTASPRKKKKKGKKGKHK